MCKNTYPYIFFPRGTAILRIGQLTRKIYNILLTLATSSGFLNFFTH
jgi:hypothetical protein